MFDRDRNAKSTCCFGIGENISLPVRLVEISSQEPAGIVLSKSVDPGDERGAVSAYATQVLLNDVSPHRNEVLMRANHALNPWLVADSGLPFISASRRMAAASGRSVFPAARENILPAAEQSPEERDLLSGRGVLVDIRRGNSGV